LIGLPAVDLLRLMYSLFDSHHHHTLYIITAVLVTLYLHYHIILLDLLLPNKNDIETFICKTPWAGFVGIENNFNPGLLGSLSSFL
jgi:hypothetical protein